MQIEELEYNLRNNLEYFDDDEVISGMSDKQLEQLSDILDDLMDLF